MSSQVIEPTGPEGERPVGADAGATTISKLERLKEVATLTSSPEFEFAPQYRLNQRPIGGSARSVRKLLVGWENPEARMKRDINILIVGQTGTGKTTLLNGFANYLCGVSCEDDFRVRLVTESDEGSKDQARSQTVDVTAYRFEWQPWFPIDANVVLVDTPGFADCGGMEMDKAIVGKIEELFRDQVSGIDSVHAVALLVKDGLNRLTTEQGYVFQEIEKLFGKDVKENFAIIVTHAGPDKTCRNVRTALKKAEIDYKGLFRFENYVLFAENGEDIESDWNVAYASYRNFLVQASTYSETSLVKSREVLTARKNLTMMLSQLESNIMDSLNMKKRAEDLKSQFEMHKTEIEANRKFTYEATVSHWVKVYTDHWTTVCCRCSHRVCHNPCYVEDKRRCCMMNDDGVCESCGCSWDLHRNEDFYYEYRTCKEKRTNDDMLARL